MKIALILAFLISPSLLFGQSKKIGVEIDHYVTIPTTYDYSFIQFGTTFGVRKSISEGFDLTTGVGLNYTDWILSWEEIGGYSRGYEAIFLPIFFKATYSINQKRVSPILSIKGGYLFDFNQDEDFDTNFFAEPRAGLQIRLGRSVKLRTGAGYNIQSYSYTQYNNRNTTYDTFTKKNTISQGVSIFFGCAF